MTRHVGKDKDKDKDKNKNKVRKDDKRNASRSLEDHRSLYHNCAYAGRDWSHPVPLRQRELVPGRIPAWLAPFSPRIMGRICDHFFAIGHNRNGKLHGLAVLFLVLVGLCSDLP